LAEVGRRIASGLVLGAGALGAHLLGFFEKKQAMRGSSGANITEDDAYIYHASMASESKTSDPDCGDTACGGGDVDCAPM
jgi:hypothetical protein